MCLFYLFRGQKAKIIEHKMMVDQLRKELEIPRIKVSQAANDIMQVTTTFFFALSKAVVLKLK